MVHISLEIVQDGKRVVAEPEFSMTDVTEAEMVAFYAFVGAIELAHKLGEDVNTEIQVGLGHLIEIGKLAMGDEKRGNGWKTVH